ncbi:MAG: tetratricopeptide repeat protein, partial [Longimicrobiales bacterium]|nr:tetratricopeptide repeat protein [Longimicrobiales bacterium]
LQRFPDDTGTRWLFGRLLFWAGNHREARRAYEAVLARTPNDPWLNLEYAPVLMALGEWGKARGVLRIGGHGLGRAHLQRLPPCGGMGERAGKPSGPQPAGAWPDRGARLAHAASDQCRFAPAS